ICANKRSDVGAGLLQGGLRFPPLAMHRRGIAVALAQERHHRIQHTRIEGRACGSIEVDEVAHFPPMLSVTSPAYTLPVAPSGYCTTKLPSGFISMAM